MPSILIVQVGACFPKAQYLRYPAKVCQLELKYNFCSSVKSEVKGGHTHDLNSVVTIYLGNRHHYVHYRKKETQNQSILMNYPRDQKLWVTEPIFKPGSGLRVSQQWHSAAAFQDMKWYSPPRGFHLHWISEKLPHNLICKSFQSCSLDKWYQMTVYNK